MTDFPFIKRLGITPEKISSDHNVCSIGFSAREQKWYGWSHRAYAGFGIDSKVKKGDCAYVAPTPEELIEDYVNFFSDVESPEESKERRENCFILSDRSGIEIKELEVELPIASSFEHAVQVLEEEIDPDLDLPQEIVNIGSHIQHCGKGEWTAQTLEDAKQMAIDYANSVA